VLPVVRVVPFREVLALEEMLPVIVRALVLDAELDDVDRVELDATGVTAVVTLLPLDASVDSAEVEMVGSDELTPVAGVSSELPADGAAPAPAPEDEPAVFDALAAVLEPLVVDWM
jgi:hypothetical protein